jgi:hypothetical protein
VNDATAFDEIGGRSVDLVYTDDVGWRGFGQFAQDCDFEPVVRFQLVEPYDPDYHSYTLKSNNFYSEVELHHLTITLEKSTGRLSVAQWHRRQLGFMDSEVVTVLGSFRGTALIVEAGLTGGYLPARIQPLSSRGCQDTLSRTQK